MVSNKANIKLFLLAFALDILPNKEGLTHAFIYQNHSRRFNP